jgi:hypothetical protein
VCRKPAERGERSAYTKESAGVAYTAWRSSAGGQPNVWLVDSGSTQHITEDRSKFTSYMKLRQPELIEGFGGEPLSAIGVGVVELQCKTSNGVGMVTLKEVRHVPKARANLFALRRATNAGTKVTMEGRIATFETNGVVCMEAEERNGLWEIVPTGEKPKAQRAGVWIIDETPWYPINGVTRVSTQKEPQAESAKEKQTEVVEIDLDSDKDGEDPCGRHLRRRTTGESKRAENPPKKDTAAIGARRATWAAAAEGVEVEEVDLRGSNENEKTPERANSGRYPERGRRPPSWLRGSEDESVWVTPKASKGPNGRAKKSQRHVG